MLYLRTMACGLGAVGRIAQTVDLTPVINAGQRAEGRRTNALLIAAKFTDGVRNEEGGKNSDYNKILGCMLSKIREKEL